MPKAPLSQSHPYRHRNGGMEEKIIELETKQEHQIKFRDCCECLLPIRVILFGQFQAHKSPTPKAESLLPLDTETITKSITTWFWSPSGSTRKVIWFYQTPEVNYVMTIFGDALTDTLMHSVTQHIQQIKLLGVFGPRKLLCTRLFTQNPIQGIFSTPRLPRTATEKESISNRKPEDISKASYEYYYWCHHITIRFHFCSFEK